MARIGERRVRTGFCWGNVREEVHLEYLGINGRIILEWGFIKWGSRAWTELVWLGIGTGDGSCEYCNELAGFHK